MPEMASPRIIVVIVFFNLAQDTIECVQSVLQSDLTCEILLVDNGSAEDSYQMVRDAFPGIAILRLPENLGFVGGYNRGIEHALELGATDVFLLNNDTIIEPTTLRLLYQSGWDVAVPKILFHDQPGVIHCAGARWRSFPPSVVMIGFGAKDGPAYDSPRPLDYAIGCALLVRRAVFEKVGAFDPDFQNYFEDYDFFYRLRAAGFKSGYVPAARLLHKTSRTTARIPQKRRWFIGRNTVLFYRKDNRFPAWQLWTFMAWLLLREALKGNFSHLADYLAGYRDGFRALQERHPG
jgi:hypothetical protein